MRSLTYLLVVASLLLSSGGVAVRSAADAAPAVGADAASAKTDDAKTVEGPAAACRLREPAPARTVPVSPLAGAPGAVLLNTRGYNYADPGRQVPAEAVPAAPQSPPAARE